MGTKLSPPPGLLGEDWHHEGKVPKENSYDKGGATPKTPKLGCRTREGLGAAPALKQRSKANPHNI